MKRIAFVLIFYAFAMIICTKAILYISNIVYDFPHVIALTLSISGIFLCGRGSEILIEEYMFNKMMKDIESVENDKDGED